jgi:dolichol-phosphate mannosyltransferase
MDTSGARIAVVMPCYRVTRQVGAVLSAIPASVWRIYCVDDACPDHSGDLIERDRSDPRIVVLRHETNQGVGGAVVTGYKRALADGATVVVKIDGDGQMDPHLLPRFVSPILTGRADYTKGNRFFKIETMLGMPWSRLLGNAVLSFMTKASSGYWNLFDPNNGYTAIHAAVLRHLPLEHIDRGYFFESDMLFRLNTLRCVVVDVPMAARYGDEVSNLRIGRIVAPFVLGHLRNFYKRIFYNYFLRDFTIASVELLLGLPLMLFGLLFGIYHWVFAVEFQTFTSTGTVMLSVLPFSLGVAMLLLFQGYDMSNTPTRPIYTSLDQPID